MNKQGDYGHWTFLTNYSHVMLSIATEPDILLREIAVRVGITERAAQRIVRDLVEGGYLVRQRVGRRNRYNINRDRPLRHPMERGRTVGDLLDALMSGRPRRSH